MFKKLLLTVFTVVLLNVGINAQTLVVDKTVNSPTVLSGVLFDYNINYTCASTTTDCLGTFITDVLPQPLIYEGVSGLTHIQNSSYDPATRTVTFEFIDPLPAGSTGTLGIQVRFPNGATPDNTTVSNTATMTANNATTATSSVNITALAPNLPYVTKFLAEGNVGPLDCPTEYRIRVCLPAGGGVLNLSNYDLTDILPAGTTFYYATQGGTESGGTVTWSGMNDLIAHVNAENHTQVLCEEARLLVTYPTPTFSDGQTITNTVNAIGDVVGMAGQQTYSDALTHDLDANGQNLDFYFTKTGDEPKTIGDDYAYGFTTFNNNSNVPLVNLEIVDTIPPQLEVNQIRVVTGKVLNVDIFYQTNTSLPNAWIPVPNNPIIGANETWNQTQIDVATFGLPPGEYITVIKWEYPIFHSKFNTNFYIPQGATGFTGTILAIDHNGNPVNPGDPMNNTAYVTYETECDNNTYTTNSSAGTNISEPYAVIVGGGKKLNGSSSNWIILDVNHGDTVNYEVQVQNDATATDSIINPVLVDHLPPYMEYIPGTWTISQAPAGTPNPIFSVVDDFAGTGRQLLRWEWTGASAYNLAPGDRIWVYFEARILPGAPPGVYNNRSCVVDWDNTSVQFGLTEEIDVHDYNGDGSVTDTIVCSIASYARMNVLEEAALESAKWVNGSPGLPDFNPINGDPCEINSDGYTRYPCVAQTTPGGIADYQLFVWNPGNIAVTNAVVVDILPHIGDTEVLEETIARDTDWEPNLAGPVVPPIGVTVFYSTETNPCRPEVDYSPSGCQAPNWSLAPPDDITLVKSLKFDFGSMVLQPGDTFKLEWPMRAPIDAPSTGEIAWNSFAYKAERADNNNELLPSEPIKVGIAVQPIDPAVYGDYVWEDLNQNGIQDDGAPNVVGVTGVLVELYEDNGDNVADPDVDDYVGFTVTDANGFYLFPSLDPGNYFAVFYPPAGYAVSPPLQGGDSALDSDGPITAVTDLMATEDDRTWDLGIYQSTECDLSINSFAVSECRYDKNTGLSQYEITVFVSWANAPAGESIIVDVDGNTQTIDVPGGVTPPTAVSFLLEADGSPSGIITAAFETTGTCMDEKKFEKPLPCSPECFVSIVRAKTEPCFYGGGTSQVNVQVTVAWGNPPNGENIEVTLDGITEIINVSTVSSPQIITFTTIADGLPHTVNAAFDGASGCEDPDGFTFDAPAPCAPTSNFDLALRKTIGSQTHDPLIPGTSSVTFDIWIFNQGSIDADNIVITDYVPTGLILNDVNWNSAGAGKVSRTLSTTAGTMASLLAPDDSIMTTITFDIADNAGGVITNFAEISEATDEAKNIMTDIDSTPDDLNNETAIINDEINDDGTIDEDDHDLECISVPVKLCEGSITLTVDKSDSYQWYKDGSIIVGATEQSLSINYDAAGDFAGEYHVVVDGGTLGSCGNQSCCPVILEAGECCPTDNCIPGTMIKVSP